MNIPVDLLYTKEHIWIKIENNFATIGLTEQIQNLLGEIVYVELPELGKEIKALQSFAIVESNKVASDVIIPLAGKIIKVNEDLFENPNLINQSPYKNGWLVLIEILKESGKENLLSSSAYLEYLEKEMV